MSIKKQVPASDDARSAALTSAKNRKDSVPPADNVISVANSAALDIEQPLFEADKALVDAAEAAYHEIVEICKAAFDKIKNRTSHAFQLFNFQIVDGIPGWKISDRSFYSLDQDGNLSPMGSESEILQGVINFVVGDTKRVAAGGPLMTMITRAEIIALQTALMSDLQERANRKAALSDAILVMVERRPIVDRLIKNIWSDVENGGQKLAAPARREYAALWGVVYKNVKDSATLTLKAVDSVTGIIIRGVNFSMGPLKGKRRTIAVTNEYGIAIIETRKFKPTYLIAENPNYEIVSQELLLSQGEEKSIVIQMVFKAIL